MNEEQEYIQQLVRSLNTIVSTMDTFDIKDKQKKSLLIIRCKLFKQLLLNKPKQLTDDGSKIEDYCIGVMDFLSNPFPPIHTKTDMLHTYHMIHWEMEAINDLLIKYNTNGGTK